MLQQRDWKQPQSFSTFLGQYFIASMQPDNIFMSAVAASSKDAGFVRWDSEDSAWVQPEQEIIRLLVEDFKEVPQVRSICAQFGSDEITIWTILRSYNREARSKIHGKELKICQTLKVYDFDFRVTSADLVSPEELVESGWREIYRRI
jgi:hypothetical protein